MRQILLPLNIILLIAVAILYYLHFNAGKKKTTATVTNTRVTDSIRVKPLKIAYVDLDTIQEHYEYYKEKMTDFDRKKEKADRDLNSAFQKIENERITFIQKGNAITQV